ncbi:MAG TPA: hypothetical protein VN924_03130 [Bryobacteraceae bacterium]|nr:hypothetical protein [Bryobacteraceae bacterium]
MTITIELAPELQAELARRAARHGLRIDAYAAGLLEDATQRPIAPDNPRASSPSAEVFEAIERLKSFGKTHKLSLGGMTIRELRHEARP